jgi:hypothetical protein
MTDAWFSKARRRDGQRSCAIRHCRWPKGSGTLDTDREVNQSAKPRFTKHGSEHGFRARPRKPRSLPALVSECYVYSLPNEGRMPTNLIEAGPCRYDYVKTGTSGRHTVRTGRSHWLGGISLVSAIVCSGYEVREVSVSIIHRESKLFSSRLLV